MLSVSRCFWWSLSALTLLTAGGCATFSVEPSTASTPTSIPHDAPWAADRGADGRMRLAYYDSDRRIRLFTQGESADRLPFHPPGSDRASSGLLVTSAGKETFVAFRDKDPQRDWFVADFDKPAALVGLGEETVPLARGSLLRKNQHLAASWYGEKSEADGKTYYVYYRERDENGRWLSEPVELFKGIYPVTSITQQGRVAAFTWVREGADHQIKVRISLDGKAFAPAQVIADLGPITPIFIATNNAERNLVLWHAQVGEGLNDFRLDGAYSDDGVQWKPTSVKALDGYDIETAEVTSDHAGNIALVATVIKTEDRLAGGKFRTVLVVSHDAGANWSPLIELRQDPLLVGKPYAHARAAKAAFLGAGKLFVVWQDWRSLRSKIHFSYSEDAGKSWLIKDQRLTAVEGLNERLPQLTKAAFPDEKGGVSIVTERMNGDLLSEKNLVVNHLSAAELRNFKAASASSAPDKERLSKRVIEYWDALDARNFEKTYAMQDPYYRSRVSYEYYKKELGRLDYRNPEIKLIDYVGPVALAVSKVTVEVKPFMVSGRTMKMDPAEKEIPTRWLWLDGDWYVEFYQQSRDLRYVPF